MPLFFFISGYLYKRRDNLRVYLNDKLIHLIIPYIIFLLLVYIPAYMPALIESGFSKQAILRCLFEITVGGRALYGYVTVFWFTTCLFLVQQIFNFIIVTYTASTRWIIVSVMLLLSYINSYFFPAFWLPWNANVVLAALPIFYIGFVYHKSELRENFFLILIISLLSILSISYLPNNTYNMKNANYGIPIVTLICSVCLILLIKKVSMVITSGTKISVLFIELGKASMVIMYLHQPFQILIKTYINNNGILAFLLSTLMSYLIYIPVSRVSVLRAFLLGSKTDFQKLGFFRIK